MPDEPQIAFLDELFSAPFTDDDVTGDILIGEEGPAEEKAFSLQEGELGDIVYVKGKDAKGHEHKGKGPGGGQFTSGASGDTEAFEPGAGKNYSNAEKIKNVREQHADKLKSKGHEPGSEVGRKRPASSVKGAYIDRNRYQLMKMKTLTKIQHVSKHKNHKPSPQERKENKAKIKEKGANSARRDLVGNNKQRRERKVALAVEFGDGKTCGCVYCGLKISFSPEFSKESMEEDKIHETAAGGKYKLSNLLPACIPCNRKRGDKDAVAFLQQSTYAQESKK